MMFWVLNFFGFLGCANQPTVHIYQGEDLLLWLLELLIGDTLHMTGDR